MIKPSQLTARAIANLEGNANWKTVLQWIDESMTIQSLKGNHLRGEETLIMQGRNLELETLLKEISFSKGYLNNAAETKKMEKKP